MKIVGVRQHRSIWPIHPWFPPSGCQRNALRHTLDSGPTGTDVLLLHTLCSLGLAMLDVRHSTKTNFGCRDPLHQFPLAFWKHTERYTQTCSAVYFCVTVYEVDKRGSIFDSRGLQNNSKRSSKPRGQLPLLVILKMSHSEQTPEPDPLFCALSSKKEDFWDLRSLEGTQHNFGKLVW